MRLGPGPVFAYEWLVATRRWQLYALRALFVVLVLVGMMLAWYGGYPRPTSGQTVSLQMLAAYGQRLFYMIVTIELSLVLLAASCRHGGGGVPRQGKRHPSDHMLATDLSNTEIVLGKLAARLIPVLGLIVCLLPLFALTSLLGGIDPTALIRLVPHLGRLCGSGLLVGAGPFRLGPKDPRSVDGDVFDPDRMAQQPAAGNDRGVLGGCPVAFCHSTDRLGLGRTHQPVLSGLRALLLTRKGRQCRPSWPFWALVFFSLDCWWRLAAWRIRAVDSQADRPGIRPITAAIRRWFSPTGLAPAASRSDRSMATRSSGANGSASGRRDSCASRGSCIPLWV